MSFENKSRVGNLQDMPLGEDRLFNLDLFNKEPISIPLLNTMNFGWNRFPIREGLNIAEAEGAITSEKEGTVSPGFDLAHDSGISRTTGMQPEQWTHGGYNLFFLKCGFSSGNQTNACTLTIDNAYDTAAIHKAITSMSIEFEHLSSPDCVMLDLPFVVPYRTFLVPSTRKQAVMFGYCYIPFLSTSSTFPTGCREVLINEELAYDDMASGFRSSTFPEATRSIGHPGFGYCNDAVSHCLTEIVKCDMWAYGATINKNTTLTLNVQEIFPLVTDNNKADSTSYYHVASQGYLLCNVSAVEYDGSPITLSTYTHVRFDKEETEDLIESSLNAWDDYMFPVKDEVTIGFLMQQKAGTIYPALPSLEVGPFEGIANTRVWASNLPFIDNDNLTKVEDIKLLSSQVLVDLPDRLLIMASFHFSDVGDNAGVRTFLYDYKTPSSFTGGYYIKDFDNTKRLYVQEITGNQTWRSALTYYDKEISNVETFYKVDYKAMPKYSKQIATTIYAGSSEFVAPLLDANLHYSIGQCTTFVDTSQQDNAFLAVHDFKSFIMPGITVPMLYPSISLYCSDTVTYLTEAAFTGAEAGMLSNQYTQLYSGKTVPINTVHFFPTTPISAGNVWSSMPMDSETYLGIDLNQHDIPITSKLLQLNDKTFSLVNGVVYESTYNRVLNANLLKKVSDASEGAYVMANLLLTGSDRATDIYSYTKDTGIAHIVTIPDAICARPYMVKDVAMIPTRSFDNAHIRIYAFRENILKLVKDIPVTLAMPDETYTNYTDSPGLGCPWTLQNVLTHRLDNGNLGLSYLQYDSMIPAMYLYSSIITADAGISDVTTKMETDNVKFIPYYQHEGNDTMAYSLTDKQYEVTTTDVTEYSITSHRLSIPERYNQRFIGTQIVIQLEDFLLIDNILSFRYVLNGASTVTTSSFTSYTKDKIIIDLDMREIDSISYEIDITQDSSDIDIAIKNVVLVGYYTSTTY